MAIIVCRRKQTAPWIAVGPPVAVEQFRNQIFQATCQVANRNLCSEPGDTTHFAELLPEDPFTDLSELVGDLAYIEL